MHRPPILHASASNLGMHASPQQSQTRWSIRDAIKRTAGYEYAMQAASGFSQGRHFLDSGASKSLINDSSMLSNMRPLPWPRMVIGLTGPKMIKYCGDLNLSMHNTSGEVKNIVIEGVYYDPNLKYNLISVSDMTKADYATTFSSKGDIPLLSDVPLADSLTA